VTSLSITRATTRTLIGATHSRALQSLFIKREALGATLYKPILVEDRNVLIKEGRYFNYREQGYITYKYRKKNIVSTIATTKL
jgi:hypothetical protein